MSIYQSLYKKLPSDELEFALMHDDVQSENAADLSSAKLWDTQTTGLNFLDSSSLGSLIENSQTTLVTQVKAQHTEPPIALTHLGLAKHSSPSEVFAPAKSELGDSVIAISDGVDFFRWDKLAICNRNPIMEILTGKTITDYYSGSANGDAGYDIWVHFSGSGWTQSLQKAFIDTANYLTSVITADIGGGIVNGKKVDDLYVSAELGSIDGVGGILGQASANNIWSKNELTASGTMQFDLADTLKYQASGLWDDIVTHEFMHVLGFGSLWNYGSNPLVPTSGQYIGSAALSAYKQVTNANNLYIPVETDGGTGTANSHWDEVARGSELMTGYINDTNVLSKYSVMSLADLGYQVSYKDYPYDNVVIG